MGIIEIMFAVFLFALGASVGSFLNVVVFRLPREMSIVRPSSHCPSCKHPIAWHDNVPVLAWFFLRGRCRHCRAAISPRYPAVELVTGLLFITLYWCYFSLRLRAGIEPFTPAGWLIYGGHVFLVGVLLASSLIDAEHWIIPLNVSYAAVLIGLVLSMIWPYWVTFRPDTPAQIIPYGSARSGAAALGAVGGLALSLVFVRLGWIKRSFAEVIEAENRARQKNQPVPDVPVNIRGEMVREMAFLAPVVVMGLLWMAVLTGPNRWAAAWSGLLDQQKWIAGLLGSVYGFMIGGAVVWATRILGSLAFGREAMGLGDVHLMAAVGAILGWTSPVIAFFLAPFLALGWALARWALHRTREIPYGPFLAAATLIVMIGYDPIVDYFRQALTGPTLP